MITPKFIFFLTINIVIALVLWWLSGYNFDVRSPVITIWTVITGFWCVAIAAFMASD